MKDPLVKFIETQVGPLDMIAMMYPLDPLRAVSFTRNKKAVIQQILVVAGPQVPVHPAAQHVRGAVRELPGGDRREDSQPGQPVGAARPDDPPWRHARGSQDGDRRRRGLHRLRAAAVARQQRAERHQGGRHDGDDRRCLGRPRGRDGRGSHAILRRHGHPHADARRHHRRQSQQRLAVHARPARAGGLRIRHQRRCRPHGGLQLACALRRIPCGSWPTRPTAAPSSTATTSAAGSSR